MGFKLYASREDRIKFITSLDDAVVAETEEQRDAFKRYLDTGDETLLTLQGEPVRWQLRPLTMATWELACRDARGIAVKGIYTDLPTARELLRLSCEDADPWPAEWGKKEDAFRFEYRRKVLSPQFAERIPPGVCLEAAKVLLDSLPLDQEVTAPFGESGGR